MQSAHVGLDAQRPVDGVGERLALVQKGARQGPASSGRPAYLQNHQPQSGSSVSTAVSTATDGRG